MLARLSLTEAQRDAVLSCGSRGDVGPAYPGRVLRQGEVMPLHLAAFIAEPVAVSPDAIGGFARRK